MDTTPEYIKMCEKAGEIQAIDKEGCLHEWFACPECGEIANEDDTYYWADCGDDKELIWLPRQDQLQEIWAEHEYGNERANNWVTFALDQFSYWVLNEDVGFSTLDASFEQLWLAFVMKEKHGKTWTGEVWE